MGNRCCPVYNTQPAVPTYLPVLGRGEESEEDDTGVGDDKGNNDIQSKSEDSSESDYEFFHTESSDLD